MDTRKQGQRVDVGKQAVQKILAQIFPLSFVKVEAVYQILFGARTQGDLHAEEFNVRVR